MRCGRLGLSGLAGRRFHTMHALYRLDYTHYTCSHTITGVSPGVSGLIRLISNPPSSLSSPRCGHRICRSTTARIIIPHTNRYIRSSGITIAVPTIRIGRHENACPIANVAVTSAVLGKTNENQVIENTSRPGPIVDQCAKLAMKKKKSARLVQLA
jgi:hypothetical protein